jgi:cyclopropane fatty-acyl-phospholipid synthase-like methyltransferase
VNKNNWQQVWRNRSTDNLTVPTLEDLIQLDGFDEGAGRVRVEDWRKYAELIIDKLQMKRNDCILEVGCGSGALLYALNEHLELNVSGIDYSENLIKVAKRVLPKGEMQVVEAKNLDETKRYDFVISNGVFHYFDLPYAKQVLLKMVGALNRTGGGIYILDIPDLSTRDDSEEIRKKGLRLGEYENKYKDLMHNYYPKEFFTEFASEFGLKCRIFPSFIPNYNQAKYRFCVELKH